MRRPASRCGGPSAVGCLEEEAQRDIDRAADEARRARVARQEAQERAVAIAVVVLFALLVLAGLASSAADESPCTLTMTVGYAECREDLGPGIRIEWPWSQPD